MKTLLLLLLLATPLAGQRLDPDRDWNSDQWQHVGAGAVINTLVRGPWTAPSWNNRAWKRIVLSCAVGAAYESLQAVGDQFAGRRGEGFGFGLLDLKATCLGAALLELVL